MSQQTVNLNSADIAQRLKDLYESKIGSNEKYRTICTKRESVLLEYFENKNALKSEYLLEIDVLVNLFATNLSHPQTIKSLISIADGWALYGFELSITEAIDTLSSIHSRSTIPVPLSDRCFFKKFAKFTFVDSRVFIRKTKKVQ